MPHYHRYRLRWGKVGICNSENYNSPTYWESTAGKSPCKSRQMPLVYTRGDGGADY